jgi:hypothetical protein
MIDIPTLAGVAAAAGVVVWEASKRLLNGKGTSIRQMLAVQSEKLDSVVTNLETQTRAFNALVSCVNDANNRLSHLEGEHKAVMKGGSHPGPG